MKKSISILIILLVFISLLMSCDNKTNNNNGSPAETKKDKLSVFVSILPQKYFLEQIGQDRTDVSVMVKPGASPATYEPKPSQMMALEQADVYISIGVPFEKVWLSRIKSANPKMTLIQSDKGIKKRQVISGHHDHSEEEENHRNDEAKHNDDASLDPHIWLSPQLVKKQCENITRALSEIDPSNADFYKTNLKSFIEDIDHLDNEIKTIIDKKQINHFMVFHPAWGYFAKHYGLEQIPVEIEGKEPSPRELSQFIDIAKNKGIKIIFIQPQFSMKSAKSIAKSINGEVIPLDPLAEDWMKNLREVAKTFSNVLKNN